MPCRIDGGARYKINNYIFPQPESTRWEKITVGEQLSTALPMHSIYQRHVWRYPALPNEPYASRIEALIGTVLTELVTDSPDDAEDFTAYSDARCLGISRSHSWNNPRGIEISFLVFTG